MGPFSAHEARRHVTRRPCLAPSMDDTPTSRKRGRKSEAPPTPVDVLDEVDDELVGWPAKRGKKRKNDSGARERSSSVRGASADRRSASRVPDSADDARHESDDNDDDASEDESDVAEGDALADDEFSRQQTIYAAQQRSMGLLSHLMDEDQLERHMASRRGSLNKGSVRKLVNHVLSQTVNQHIVMAVSGVGKVFVGEMVELARTVQRERHESGPILPLHLYEAYRRYKNAQERPGRFPPGLSSGGAGLGRRRRLFS